jgi:trk system potassium uptake protein TrkH
MRIRFSNDKIIIFSYFIGIIAAGSLLLMLPWSWEGPEPLRYIDALFTSTSAVCVTGLITVDTALYTRFGQTVIALLIQFGGLGIITFATIYVALPRKRISLVNRGIIKDFYIAEVEHNPKSIVRSILIATFGIEAVGAALLYTRFHDRPDGLFVSVFHAVSAFCNAGFSTFSNSLEGFVADPLVNFTIMGLIVSGGIGFLVLQDIGKRLRGRKRRLSSHSRIALAATAFLVIVGAAAFFILEYRHAMSSLNLGQKAMASLFQSVTPRTAGFGTILQSSFTSASVLITILLMFIGASPASTGGGIKTTTFFVLALAALRGTDERDRLVVGKRVIPASSILKALGILGKGFLVVFAALTLLLVVEHSKIASGELGTTQALFEVVSAFGTVGLSLGITSGLSATAKGVIILTMFAGRVGIFAMSLPLGRARIDRYADFPRTDVLVG